MNHSSTYIALANRTLPPPTTTASETLETTTNISIMLNETLLSENKSEDENIPIAVPLLNYITNIMRSVEGVISNNITDDHRKEFVKLMV